LISKLTLFLVIAIASIPLGESNNCTTIEEVLSLVASSSRNVTSYSYTTDLKEEIGVEESAADYGDRPPIFIRSFTEGRSNLTAAKSWESTLMVMSYGSADSSALGQSEAYILNDTIYLGAGGNWTSFRFSSRDAIWSRLNVMGAQLVLLNGSSAKLEGSESIDGTPCCIIRSEPNLNAYMDMITESMSSLSPGSSDMANFYNNSTALWVGWVGEDDHLLKKSYLEMNLSLSPEAVGLADGAEDGLVNLRANVTMFFDDYEHPVSISLPEEAKDAVLIEPAPEEPPEASDQAQVIEEAFSEERQGLRFPLKGGNEHGNATVFSSTAATDRHSGRTMLLVDMALSDGGVPLEVFLVDSLNNYYRGEVVWSIQSSQPLYGAREIYGFLLLEGIEVDHLSVTPRGGEPFSIDWIHLPEASAGNLSMKFLELEEGYNSG
jgi:hypothetical protein